MWIHTYLKIKSFFKMKKKLLQVKSLLYCIYFFHNHSEYMLKSSGLFLIVTVINCCVIKSSSIEQQHTFL